jgi:hypothetical protein
VIAMRNHILNLFVAVPLAGCGNALTPAALDPAVSAPAPEAPTAPVTAVGGRELVNPDHTTMVLLYYDLAGLPVPIEQSLEDDMRVRMARPTDKPAQREVVRKELEAGLAGVHGVGALRLSLHANLSEYDATYGEFTVRALAPSSVVEFQAMGQTVQLRFGNARTAQVWKVPAGEAQGVRDRVGFSGDVSVDALLKIRDVHAAPKGGAITVDVIEYELRENRGGTLLGRVQLAR